MTPTPSPSGPRLRDPRPPVPPVGETTQRRAWPLEIYRTGVGKKYVMAITGIVLMAYVFLHMVGNLKLYFGAESLNTYSEWLRHLGEPALPRETLLWAMRLVLITAAVLHVHAAWSLTRMNRRARPQRYASDRDYVAASFASRTMRWTGVIVLLFVLFHLLDLTWGTAHPDFVKGDVHHNVVESFQRWPVSLVYIAANVALALHVYHGAWSLFQSMGWSNRRFNHWRRWFAVAFAGIVGAGNIAFPVAVLAGLGS